MTTFKRLLVAGWMAWFLVFPAVLGNWLAQAADDVVLSMGQTVYVPAYSHIYSGDREYQIPLAVTLSIRNTDPENELKLHKVDYYDSHGKLLKSYLTEPLALDPMSTVRYVIKQSDLSGGSGANFLVKWISDKPLNIPIIESINISTMSSLGISFTSRGRAIKMP